MGKKTVSAKLKERKIAKPNKFIAFFIKKIFASTAKKNNVEYKYEFDLNKFKKTQFILLAQHASSNDYTYVNDGLRKFSFNIIGGYRHFYSKGLTKLMLMLGIIPKHLYQPDIRAVRDIDRVIKMGGNIMLFPEGIQSVAGSQQPINPSTIKLLTKYKLPIVLCSSEGAYLSNPRFSGQKLVGKIIYTYSLLFSADDYNTHTSDDLWQLLEPKMHYNDFQFNKKERIEYIGENPNAYKLDSILYHCPKCDDDNSMTVVGDKIVCNKCGNGAVVNHYYDLVPLNSDCVIPNTIDMWYKWQIEKMKKKILKNLEFSLSSECNVLMLDELKPQRDPSVNVGSGICTLNKTGLRYKGTYNNKKIDFTFPINTIPSLSFTPFSNFATSYNGVYYAFEPKEDKRQVVKWMIACEVFNSNADLRWAYRRKESNSIK